MDFKLLKLTNGDEIIGRFVSGETDFIHLSHVRVFVVHPDGKGQATIQMIPWLVSAPDVTAKIDRTHIVGEATTSLPKELEDAYLKHTTQIQI